MSHRHAGHEWYSQKLAQKRAGNEFRAPAQVTERRALPRRSRWQRVRDELARWLR